MKRLMSPLFGLLLVFVPACQARGGDPSGTGPSTPAPTEAAAPKVPAATVLARVNGTDIPSDHLERALKLFLEKNSPDPGSAPAARLQDLRKQLLESLVSSELLYQASQAAGIRVDDDAVARQIQVLQGRFPSDAEFTKYLQDQGFTLDEMKEQARRNLATEQMVQRDVDSKVSVSDQEIAGYYEKNKERMRRPETVKVSQIFAAAGSRAGADAKSKARQKMELILKEVRGGKDFAELARQFSESPDAKDGGEMGYISRNGNMPVLSEAAFKLKVGEVSDVVETPFGYHLLKVTDKKAAGDVTLEEARPQISALLFRQKEQEAFNAYLTTLKAGAKIEILTPTP